MQKAECVDTDIGILVTSLRKGEKKNQRIWVVISTHSI